MSNNPFLDKLENLGYESHNPNEPLYKYTTADTFKIILKNNSLRYCNPQTFNDPFEFSDDCFDFNLNDAEFRSLLAYNASFAPLDIQKRYQEQNTLNTFRKDLFIEANRKYVEAVKYQALIFCTSLSPLIPLMWSHYAIDHKGICFGIKMPIDFENENEMVITKSIVYNEKIKPYSMLTKDKGQIMLAVYNWIYSKSKVWEYENEVRTYRNRRTRVRYENDEFVIPEGKEYEDITFDKESLIEIYYGLKTLQKDIDEIEHLIKENGYENVIHHYKMEKIKGTYQLEPILFK